MFDLLIAVGRKAFAPHCTGAERRERLSARRIGNLESQAMSAGLKQVARPETGGVLPPLCNP